MPPTPSPSAKLVSAPNHLPPNQRTAADVLPRLSCRHHRPAPGLGRRLSPRPLSADVLLQLLVSQRLRNHRPFLEPRQLPRAPDQARLLANLVALHVDRPPRHLLLHAPRLSARLLALISRRTSKRPLLSARHHPALGKLFSPRLCLEDNPRHRRSPEHAPAIRSPHQSSAGLPALQPVRRRTYPDPH